MMLLGAVALMLAGCAARVSGGNEHGAIVDYRFSSTSAAFAAAEEHCRKHGKKARASQVATRGKTATFDCIQ